MLCLLMVAQKFELFYSNLESTAGWTGRRVSLVVRAREESESRGGREVWRERERTPSSEKPWRGF